MNLFKTLKKVYKTGYFRDFELKKNYLSFVDCNDTKYVLQPARDRLGSFIMRIGHVEVWTRTDLTYESDYCTPGLVECAAFIDHWTPVKTDNPDFVLRASLNNLFPQTFEL
jgi:hypothetical protein